MRRLHTSALSQLDHTCNCCAVDECVAGNDGGGDDDDGDDAGDDAGDDDGAFLSTGRGRISVKRGRCKLHALAPLLHVRGEEGDGKLRNERAFVGEILLLLEQVSWEVPSSS